MKRARSVFEKIYRSSPRLLRKQRVAELIKAYEDMEKLIRNLRDRAEEGSGETIINVRKLIAQLSDSKKVLERKIGNTILIEKHHVKRRLKNLSQNLRSRDF